MIYRVKSSSLVKKSDTSKYMFFRLNTAPTRGHSLKLIKPRCHLDVRKYSFAHRAIDIWNSLEENTIACDSINGFKGRSDKFVYGRGFI